MIIPVSPESNDVPNIVGDGLHALGLGQPWDEVCDETGERDLAQMTDGDPQVQFVDWFGAMATAIKDGDADKLNEFITQYDKFAEEYQPLYVGLLNHADERQVSVCDTGMEWLTWAFAALMEGFAFQAAAAAQNPDSRRSYYMQKAMFTARKALIIGWLDAVKLEG